MKNYLTLESSGLTDSFLNSLTPKTLSLLVASGCNELLNDIEVSTVIELHKQGMLGLEALIYEEKLGFSEQIALHTLSTKGVLSSIIENLEHHLIGILEQLSTSLTNDDLYTICTILRVGNFNKKLYSVLQKSRIVVYTYKGQSDSHSLENDFIILDFNGVLYMEGDDNITDIDIFTSNNGYTYHGIAKLYGHNVFIQLSKGNAYNIFPIINIDMTHTGKGQYRIIQESEGVYHLANLEAREIIELGFVNSIRSDDGSLRIFHDNSFSIVQDLINGEFTKVKGISGLEDASMEILPTIKLH